MTRGRRPRIAQSAAGDERYDRAGGYAPRIVAAFDALDWRIAARMAAWGVPALRWSLALIFVWFGMLKPLGLSPAAPLVLATVGWLPLLTPAQWLALIGWWEVAIGVTFLFQRTLRIAIALLALQMVGTFMPLALLPEVTFQTGRVPFAPTIEGQYIIKNLLIISAALVVGGTVRRSGRRAGDAHAVPPHASA